MGSNRSRGLVCTSERWRREEPHVPRSRMEGRLESARAG